MLAMLANPADAPPHVGNMRRTCRLLPGDVIVTHVIPGDGDPASVMPCIPFALAVASRRLRIDQTGPRVHVYLYIMEHNDSGGFEWLLPNRPLEQMVYLSELLSPPGGPAFMIPADELELQEVLTMGTVFLLSEQMHDTITDCVEQLENEEEPAESESSDDEDDMPDAATLQARREQNVAYVGLELDRSQRSRGPSRAFADYLSGL
jgi:hypothetical protein